MAKIFWRKGNFYLKIPSYLMRKLRWFSGDFTEMYEEQGKLIIRLKMQ